ncbi:MAG: spore maturation protein [Clostridia bacterium]|nr:spore maturation protein [Clostridia bacterium]
MNAIFAAVFLLTALLFLFTDPEGFLAALLEGGEKAALLSLSLLAAYCVWLGFFKVLEKSGLAQKLSLAVFPATKRLFRSGDREALFFAGGNLTANFLGLPGAPTPLGIRATKRFLSKNNGYAADMLFVLNATSLQLLPTTVIALRLAAGSLFPSDIFLPTLIATLFSTLLGGFLVWITGRKAHAHEGENRQKRRPLV